LPKADTRNTIEGGKGGVPSSVERGGAMARRIPLA